MRYVTDGQCRPTIVRMTLPSGSVNDFTNTLDELDAQGFNRVDRKYLRWVDTPKWATAGSPPRGTTTPPTPRPA